MNRTMLERADSTKTTDHQSRGTLLTEATGQRHLREFAAELSKTNSAKDSATDKYSLTGESVLGWLKDIKCNPPTAENIQAAKTKGKLSDEQVRALQSTEFQNLANTLAAGKSPTKNQLEQALPEKLQDRITGDLVYKFSAYSTGADGKVDLGKVALALRLGRLPEPGERSTAQNVATARLGEDLFFKMWNSDLEWKDISPYPVKRASCEQTSISAYAKDLVSNAKRVASARNTVGKCYSGVADALDAIGVHLTGQSAYMAAEQLAARSNFDEVSIKDLQPGDVLVHGKSGSHPDGHIAVYLGNNEEASDHVQSLIRGANYGGTRVFRLRNATV
jgi:hypothetical protein